MTVNFSAEMNLRVYNVHDYKYGDYLEVCCDADGLGLVELRQVEASGTITNRIVMTEEQAYMFLNAQQFFLEHKNVADAL